MVTLSLYQSLPNLIESIGQEHFYDQVANSIQTLDVINEIKIVSYSKTDKPVFLGECPMSKLDEMYCESAYLLDPIYDLVCQKKHKDMVTLDSLVTHPGVGGAPLLTNTAANFQCEKYQVVDGGDHWIMIGKVVAFENHGRAPLLYVQGNYAGAIPFTGAKTPAQNVASDKTLARLHDSAIYLMHKVLQKVQENYLPKQSATGLSTGEARLLLVLSDTTSVTLDDLSNLVTIPSLDVADGVESLKGFGLISSDLSLTEKGQEMAERLWAISNQQQADIFANFKEDELASFKQQLQHLLKQLA
ncbi:p-hydroxyphenylacetate 3-hydroxylase, reductase component [Marinomonas spartinae]|uniref:p-hydroxyphenylacetate 3-hydroxylase, reductase component n=1 Tax=Marinomonas spartinae TaxID=1792290 RepID=A0A1A8TMD0_9GAMM|nr:flavin reductase [Marinomonas spartinae]SBS33728.1 p-hydroxyphenylacetate 3-hydroxylase, reductase component [Marinomonas spartinae]